MVPSTGLAEKWPETGPPILWSRPLGPGHSAILNDEGRLYTMYRAGNGRAKQGPWDAEETVVAMDAASGKTLWEHKYPSRREDFSFGAGPHSTPLIVGDRLFTIGTNKQLFAFDKKSGRIVWSHDLIKEFNSPELLIRPVVKTGYGCSPIAYRDTIICSVGGPGQSVMAFRQSDGGVVWRSGDFLTSEAPPIMIEMGGQPQLVISGAAQPNNPLGDGRTRSSTGSRCTGTRSAVSIVLPPAAAALFADPLTVFVGDHVYGTTGDFGPAFLTALDIKTGQAAWQHRGFGRASLLYADGKAIIMDEDGDLALAKLAPEGVTILSEAKKVFDTTTWTVPTLVGKTLYARDREKIVALNLGAQ